MLIAARKLSWADGKNGCVVISIPAAKRSPGQPPGASVAMNPGWPSVPS